MGEGRPRVRGFSFHTLLSPLSGLLNPTLMGLGDFRPLKSHRGGL